MLCLPVFFRIGSSDNENRDDYKSDKNAANKEEVVVSFRLGNLDHHENLCFDFAKEIVRFAFVVTLVQNIEIPFIKIRLK